MSKYGNFESENTDEPIYYESTKNFNLVEHYNLNNFDKFNNFNILNNNSH